MKYMITLAIMASMLSCTAQNQENGTYADVTNEEAKVLISERPNLLIIDVRTDPEVEQGMIEGADQVDISRSDFEERLATLDRNAPVLVYCAAGGRSKSAQKKMEAMGFKEVYNLKTGYNGWK